MITLETVLLLQQKVEGAVEKIRQLQNDVARLNADKEAMAKERDALLAECAEAKAQLSSLLQNQTQIENSILHSLDRLEAIPAAIKVAPAEEVEKEHSERENSFDAGNNLSSPAADLPPAPQSEYNTEGAPVQSEQNTPAEPSEPQSEQYSQSTSETKYAPPPGAEYQEPPRDNEIDEGQEGQGEEPPEEEGGQFDIF